MHRLDKNTPIEETAGAMSKLVKEGKVGYLGLSEVFILSLLYRANTRYSNAQLKSVVFLKH
jgi:aryl-alcohol dehydrogenase-like predicted oxidoreductase